MTGFFHTGHEPYSHLLENKYRSVSVFCHVVEYSN